MLFQRFRKFVREEGLVPPGARVLAAVSGGSDSVAMLLLLARLAREEGQALCVASVDHGLRPEGADDVAFVGSLAASLGLPFLPLRGDARAAARERRVALPQAARELRYGLLEGAAREAGAERLALGHTLDDQAETLLMNICRGCGIDGLGGIRPAREGRIVRPLLALGRAELAAWLAAAGRSFRTDPSNADRRFTRNRVRLEIMPLLLRENPHVARLLAALAAEARAVGAMLDGEARAFLAARAARAPGEIAFDREAFAALPAPVRGAVVRRAILELDGTLLGVYRSHLEAVEALARSAQGSRAATLPRGLRARREYGTIAVARRGGPPPAPDEETPVSSAGAWVHRGLGVRVTLKAPAPPGVFPLTLRGRREGDRLWGRKKSLKKLLADAKVPRSARDFVPLLLREGRVIGAGRLFRAAGEWPAWEMEPLGEPVSPYFRWLRGARERVQ